MARTIWGFVHILMKVKQTGRYAGGQHRVCTFSIPEELSMILVGERFSEKMSTP